MQQKYDKHNELGTLADCLLPLPPSFLNLCNLRNLWMLVLGRNPQSEIDLTWNFPRPEGLIGIAISTNRQVRG
jgi:hypothetical protein